MPAALPFKNPQSSLADSIHVKTFPVSIPSFRPIHPNPNYQVMFTMNNLARLSTAVVCCASISLAGCFAPPKNLNVMHMGPPYQIAFYDRGRPIGERKLEAMSNEEQIIAQWIEANRQGWRPSTANQPPGRVVKGDGFTLNFTEDTCYLFIPPDPKAKQKHKGKGQTEPIYLQKRLTPGDLELAQVLNAGV